MSLLFRTSALLALATGGFAFAGTEPTPFDRAVYSEVVNQVSTISASTTKATSARSGDNYAAPDLVKSGRKSHAQLTGPDGTIVRVGANTVFSLGQSTRSIRLEGGAVLFHSPPGKGGGSIVTNTATCSVIGTTVIVEKLPNGGVKLQVLEGVAKFGRNGVEPFVVKGGQSAIIPADPEAEALVATLTLDSLQHAELIAEFEKELPSMQKIASALGALQVISTDNKSGLKLVRPNLPDVTLQSPNGEGQVN